MVPRSRDSHDDARCFGVDCNEDHPSGFIRKADWPTWAASLPPDKQSEQVKAEVFRCLVAPFGSVLGGSQLGSDYAARQVGFLDIEQSR